ncbi:polycystin-1 [Notolabrus celidotus]|uniref:polycystin-1 n=1 Tax=Notolabrus celidotus TaxID=1203425 RepID=UPI00148F993E|nr:polycystin-1 [Notolabrus celidotus]
MTGTLTPQRLTLWILSVVLITAAGEDISCPEGGRIHLAEQKCYWLSEITLSWPGAQSRCKDTPRGDLARADSSDLQTFVFHSFPVRTPVWVWLKGSEGEKFDQAGIVESMSPALRARHSAPQMLCPQMALGRQGGWRRAPCAEPHLFLCEKELTQPELSVNSYLLGLAFMTGIYAQTKVRPLPNTPDIGQLTVEMQLFPGMWFSHAGQLKSVDLMVQPNTKSSVARVQILRPYCNPNHHLVPPGCSSLLNPFSCCSAVPLCNTTGGCSRGQYWCHLLETCVCTTCPCSPYDSAVGSRGFVLPPRYPTLPPFYHLVADLPLTINPSPDLRMFSLLLPDQAILVFPDDIVALQHTRSSGTFLRCLQSEASAGSPWRQSYLSLRGTEWGSWWEGGLTSLPPGGQWVDGVVCDLRMLYEDNLPTGTEHDEKFCFTERHTTTAPTVQALTSGPTLGAGFGLTVIHPVPDQNNQIHVQIHVPTLIVVKVLSGEYARSSWSAPVQQTGVPFFSHCPEEVTQVLPECTRQSGDTWFSSVTLVLPSEGVQTLNISVMDAVSSQDLRVKVWGYEAVTGLSVEPHRCWRMIVDTPQIFVARVERGSSVRFSWVIDDLDDFAHEGESYSVVFKKPSEYSAVNQLIFLTADEISPMAEPEFLLVREVVAVDAVRLYSLRVKVDVSLPITFSWDFGDGSNKVIHYQSAPCLTMQGVLRRQQKHVYVQDTVNHAYSVQDDFKLHVRVFNKYDTTDAFMKISILPELTQLLVSPSLPVPSVKETLVLEASTEPFSRAVLYTWDFGDGSEAVQSTNRKILHTFETAGVYNITVCANNSLTVLRSSLRVEVQENISGLTISCNEPAELSSPVDLRATVGAGTGLIWTFDFGDGSLQGNLKDGSISHVYTSPGNYTVDVTVLNSVSRAHQSIMVQVYRLAVSGVLPTGCVTSGEDVQLRALVNGNTSNLTFHWLIGDGSALAIVKGNPTTMHRFQKHGVFPVGLTVLSSVTSVSFNTSICVELRITNITVQTSSGVAAAGEEVCFQVLVSPEQTSGYSFTWFRSSSGLIVTTERSHRCFIFKDEGDEEVSVTASNTVSNKTANATVSIQTPVGRLSVSHSLNDTLTVNEPVSFWVTSCAGSDVSVLWDFGDGSPVQQKPNTSHVFTSKGQFTVTATAFNAVSRQSVTLNLNVSLPQSELSLHTDRPYAAVGEEALISAVSSNMGETDYNWTVDGVPSTKQGGHHFRFAFKEPGVFEIRVTAQNLVSRREATILIEVFERIEGLQIVTNMKYVPTQEEIRFTSAVTKGSSVKYHWLATQTGVDRRINGDGSIFDMIAEAPGEVLIQLRASNKLGEVTSTVSLVAVQRVVIADKAQHPRTAAVGKPVNISVSVLSGSHLRFSWYVNSDILPEHTSVPFLLHTFVSVGRRLVRVSVQNVLGQRNVTMEFNIQEEVQEADFEMEGKKPPFFITTGAAVRLKGVTQTGNDLSWTWRVEGTDTLLFNGANQTFMNTFPHAGIYQVSLNVSNQIDWKHVSHSVTVLDEVTGFTLNMSKSSICTEEQVTFTPTVYKGSNVSFVITFRNKDWTHSESISKEGFTTSSLPAGKTAVRVKAWNHVSSAEVSSSILVTEQVQGLRLVNCCSADLEALKGIQFKAEVQKGPPVNYTWMFLLEGSYPTRLMGQEVIFSPPHSGSLSYSVTATRGVCSKTLNETSTVHRPLQQVNIVCLSERVFVGHAVLFSAAVNGWSNISYLWSFGDSSETLMTDGGTLKHTYHNPGTYSVVVKALSSVSHVSAQLYTEVEELRCSSPQVSLVQKHSNIFRSRPNVFEAKVDNNCSDYKTTYLWEILKESDCTSTHLDENKESPRLKLNVNSPLLSIPKHSLDVGQYCMVFTVSLQGTPLAVQQRASFKVVQSPPVAVIKGGSHRLWPSLRDLVLDGSGSKDPDAETGVEDTLQYHWTMMTTVTVFDAPVLPVMVECVSCSDLSSHHKMSYSMPVILSGQCEQCDDETKYEWSAEDQTGVNLDLNEVSTSTGRKSANLVIRSGVLQPRQSYTFSLNVSQPSRGQWGSASLTILPNNPPYGGLCDLSPESDIRVLETLVTYNCSGWQDDGSDVTQLIYTLQVSPCQQTGPKCPLLTLYRGTRSTYHTLVPMGSPGPARHTSVITVTVLVEDYLGAKVVALNRTLTVGNPAGDKVSSPQLRNKGQTELQALVQRGNPQEIIPYSIALTSQLNQMESGQTAGDLKDRREIHDSVIQALTSLPVSSLLDVDQISAALSQSMAIQREMVSHSSQEKVLKAVQNMIQVMEEQTSPGAQSAVDRGRNILNIIGNTLTAASFSSQQTLSSPLQPASSTFLSVLGHTRALMRSLMNARVHGEAPLSLSSPYLNAVGFLGDPSDLLCTHHSNQNQILPPQPSTRTPSCQFHIPDSFTTYLKRQEPEVVQVLFGMDADTGPNSILASADPPISTSLVAMELTTPQGRPIPIQGLDPEHAIRIILPNKQPPVGPNDLDGDWRVGESGNETCVITPLPAQGELNFTVRAVDGLGQDAGLYISFNFSHDAGPGVMNLGHVKIEVSFAAPGTNESYRSLSREWALTFSASTTWKEEAIFLSPHSLCRYYSVHERRWSSEGLQPLDGSTLHAAHCLTKHLTLFGASMFVYPRAVVLLPPSDGPIRNVVVGIVCAVLVLIHILMGLIAYKLDHFDSLRLSQVPLCSQPGLYHYRVLVKTGRRRGAGTTAHVGICLYGVTKSGSRHLQREGAFQRGSLDQFHLETDENLREIWKIRIWHDNTGLDPSWYVQHVVVWDPQTDHMFFFMLEDWLSVENQKSSSVEREVLTSCPEELYQFGRVLGSQLVFGMVEHHLWLSLWERPAHSRFTRCQRITCSALTLHLYLALGALWYGAVGTEAHSGPVAAQLLLNMETVAVGLCVAVLVFPLQSCLCFLFRQCNSQVSKDMSTPSSPVCPSGEIYLCQSELSGPSFLSFADSSGHVRDSPFSLLESKLLDSSILDFWATSGLAAQTDRRVCREDCTETWQSCDSLLSLPVDPCLTKSSPAPIVGGMSVVGPARQIRRKKAMMQPRQSSSSPTDPTTASVPLIGTYALSKGTTTLGSKVSAFNSNLVQAYSHNLTTFLTLSEEDLLMSIAAASEDPAHVTNSNSDSGRDSPRTTSSFSNTQSSSWSQQSEDKSFFADIHKPDPDPLSCPSLYGAGLHKSPSVLSVDSVASTFLPSPSTESSRSCSSTRIGVARSKPGWLLPHWALCVIYSVVAVLLGTCLTVVGVYGGYMSRTVVIMWLVSVLSAFFTSALLLEPLKVCMQALISTALWRPVDPEVEDHLAQESTVVRPFREHCGNVRPPCGYGLLQAKEEARRVRALQSLMRHCVVQLLFLLLVLMVNYQDSAERRQGRLLLSAVRHRLHTAPSGVPNLTSLRDWSDAEQWINHTLVPNLHQYPSLHLVGLPQLQYTHTLSPLASYFLEDHNVTTQHPAAGLHMPEWSKKQLRSLSIDFTLSHRESSLFVCVSIQLEWAHTHRVTPSLFIHPFLIPLSYLGLDLQTALMVLLLISGLFILFREVRSIATERAWCLHLSLLQLCMALLCLATAILHFCFLSLATSSVSRSVHLLLLLCVPAAGDPEVCAEMGGVGQSAAESLEGAAGCVCPVLPAAALLSPREHLEGFLSLYENRVSVLSFLRGRIHPGLGLLLFVGGLWLLSRLCGAVLIHAYRAEQAELHRPTIGPQDFEMVEFFIKRLRLWMGLTKAKEFRHRVKFEGMDMPPSRSSQESRLSTLSPFLSSPRSPSTCSSFSSQRPLSSALSVRSEDSSFSESDVQPYLDHLLPCVTSLLSHFDQVNQINEDVYDLEKKLEDAQTRRRKRLMSDNPKRSENLRDSANPENLERGGREEAGNRKEGFFYSRTRVSLPSTYSVIPSKAHNSTESTCIFPQTYSAYSESESASHQPQGLRNHQAAKVASGNCGLHPAGFPGFGRFNMRRAWHSGSSHSADAAQRNFLTQGGGVGTCGNGRENLALISSRPRSEQGLRRQVRDGVPVKRKAWICEQSEMELDC